MTYTRERNSPQKSLVIFGFLICLTNVPRTSNLFGFPHFEMSIQWQELSVKEQNGGRKMPHCNFPGAKAIWRKNWRYYSYILLRAAKSGEKNVQVYALPIFRKGKEIAIWPIWDVFDWSTINRDISLHLEQSTRGNDVRSSFYWRCGVEQYSAYSSRLLIEKCVMEKITQNTRWIIGKLHLTIP